MLDSTTCTCAPGTTRYWNSHAGFSGTYASQFAVTGLSAVKGATEMLRDEIFKLAGAVFGGVPAEALELADGGIRIKENPEAFLPFMACGAIINANNAGLPEDLGVTLNCRYVYRPPFQVPDVERKFGNLTLTYAAQIHVAVIEVDPETGYYDIVDYAAVDDCGKRINPQIVEGQVMGATAQAIGAAMHEVFVYDEDGNLLTPNFYDYHVPHALDMPPLATGAIESPSPFTPLGTKGMGEGGGAGIHAVCAAIQDATGVPVKHSHNPYQRVWEMLQEHEVMNVSGERTFDAPRATVWTVLNDPASMAKTMPGVESFDIHDDRRWTANVKIPLGLGGLKMKVDMEKIEEREPEFAKLAVKGHGVGAMMNMETSFTLGDAPERRNVDGVVGGREDRRPGRLDGPARPPADRQPAGAARSQRRSTRKYRRQSNESSYSGSDLSAG